MSSAFDEVRLPVEVEQGSTGGPSFSTSVVGLTSGIEARNQNWQAQRMTYDVGYGVTSAAQTDAQDFYTLMKFFYARRGRFRGFRFKDWTDFQGTAQVMLDVNGDGKTWQLQKVYDDGVQPYTRKITRPVVGTVTLFSTTGTALSAGGYTFDATKGTAVFAATQTGPLTATFEFDVPVRFDTDVFTLTVELFNAASIQSLNIIEILE